MGISALSIFKITIIEHICLTNSTSNVRVRKSIDEARASKDPEVEELLRGDRDGGGGSAVVGVEETWIVCACGRFRHDACFKRPRLPPVTDSQVVREQHPFSVFAVRGYCLTTSDDNGRRHACKSCAVGHVGSIDWGQSQRCIGQEGR